LILFAKGNASIKLCYLTEEVLDNLLPVAAAPDTVLGLLGNSLPVTRADDRTCKLVVSGKSLSDRLFVTWFPTERYLLVRK